MRIRLSQRKNLIEKAKEKAVQNIVQALYPVVQNRFKVLKRELRDGGNLRKQLKRAEKNGIQNEFEKVEHWQNFDVALDTVLELELNKSAAALVEIENQTWTSRGYNSVEFVKGGYGSGNFDHEGRPGKVGGSSSQKLNFTGLNIVPVAKFEENKMSRGGCSFWLTPSMEVVEVGTSLHETVAEKIIENNPEFNSVDKPSSSGKIENKGFIKLFLGRDGAEINMRIDDNSLKILQAHISNGSLILPKDNINIDGYDNDIEYKWVETDLFEIVEAKRFGERIPNIYDSRKFGLLAKVTETVYSWNETAEPFTALMQKLEPVFDLNAVRVLAKEQVNSLHDEIVSQFCSHYGESWATEYGLYKGGEGSGNFDHEGRPGLIGGSNNKSNLSKSHKEQINKWEKDIGFMGKIRQEDSLFRSQDKDYQKFKEAMLNLPHYSGTVYRGFNEIGQERSELKKKYAPGEYVVINSVTSFSKDINVAARFSNSQFEPDEHDLREADPISAIVFKFNTLHGYEITSNVSSKSGMSEILVPRNTIFRIVSTKVQKVDGIEFLLVTGEI